MNGKRRQAFLRKGQSFFKNQAQIIPQDRQNKNIFLAAAASLVVASFSIAAFWRGLPPQVPLFYSLPWGKEQLGTPGELFLPIGVAALFLVLNVLLASLVTEDGFLKKSLILAAATAAVLSSITVIRVVLLVI